MPFDWHALHVIVTIIVALGSVASWLYAWQANARAAERTELTAVKAQHAADVAALKLAHAGDVDALRKTLHGQSRTIEKLEERMRHVPSAEVVTDLVAITHKLSAQCGAIESHLQRVDRRLDMHEEAALRRSPS